VLPTLSADVTSRDIREARRRRTLFVVVTLVTAVVAQALRPSVASAQSGCTEPYPPYAANLLKSVGDAFTTAENAHFRSSIGIRTLDDSVRLTVVTDARTCIAIYHAIYANVGKAWTLLDGSEFPGGAMRTAVLAEHAIYYYRIGAYYVALLESKIRGNEATDVMIFEKCDWCVIDRSVRYVAGFVSIP